MAELTIQQVFELAVQNHRAGRLQQAESLYQQVLLRQPKHPAATHYLGEIAHRTGRQDIALSMIRQAIALSPNYAEAQFNLGNILRDMGQHEEAIALFRQVIANKPDFAEAHNNLGTVLAAQGQTVQAIAAFRNAVTLKPRHVKAQINLGTALEQAGDLESAEHSYRQAIALAPKNGLYHAKLAKLLGAKLPEKDMAALNALLADPSADITSRSYLHFAAAHVLDAREFYRDAADHLRQGNALYKSESRKKGDIYDVAAHSQFVSRMIETCSPDFFQRTAGMGVQTDRPIFIIGMVRSGTTLTEQILAAHSQVFAAGELPLGQDEFLSLAGASAQNLPRPVRVDLAFQNLARVDHDTIQQLAHHHLTQLDKLNSSAPRIVDKMPENYLYLGLLATLFPRATFIHCRRDLRDVAVSCWMTRFDKLSWCNDLEDITTRFEQYGRIMQHWRKVLDGRWLDCDYEQTVADLPATARRLVDWCGLQWEPACLDFHLVKRPVRTASRTQVRQPIYTRSVGRWKHYEEFLAPVLPRLSRI